MRYDGYVRAIDRPHEVLIEGSIGYPSVIACYDSFYISSITGYIVSDSSALPTDQTFLQDQIIGYGDMTLSLKDYTYADGSQNPDGTWIDGTFQYRWFDPEWIFYSIYYQSYDNTSDYSLIGYKYREPVRSDVGEYYASMVIPETVGHYENRWAYLRDNSGSYAKEIVQPFVSMSRGIDYMSDFPDTSGGDAT